MTGWAGNTGLGENGYIVHWHIGEKAGESGIRLGFHFWGLQATRSYCMTMGRTAVTRFSKQATAPSTSLGSSQSGGRPLERCMHSETGLPGTRSDQND